MESCRGGERGWYMQVSMPAGPEHPESPGQRGAAELMHVGSYPLVTKDTGQWRWTVRRQHTM